MSSVGMFEHVGPAHGWRVLRAPHGLLRPGGRLLNHAIGRPVVPADTRRPGPAPWPAPGVAAGLRGPSRSTSPFMERYVFPDGELHEVGTVVSMMQDTDFEVRHLESLREHYALTLRPLGGQPRGQLGGRGGRGRSGPGPGVAALHGRLGPGSSGTASRSTRCWPSDPTGAGAIWPCATGSEPPRAPEARRLRRPPAPVAGGGGANVSERRCSGWPCSGRRFRGASPCADLGTWRRGRESARRRAWSTERGTGHRPGRTVGRPAAARWVDGTRRRGGRRHGADRFSDRLGARPGPHPVVALAPAWVGPPFVSIGFYVATVVFIGAWVGLGRQVWRGGFTVAQAWIVLGLWGLPFFLGPPLFSRDVSTATSARASWPTTASIPTRWGPRPSARAPAPGVDRQLSGALTTSPTGPLFVLFSTRAVVSVSPSFDHVPRCLAFRILELVGVVLVMVFLPRLARHLGTDPGVALWLGALSPLAMFSFISSGHNDALLVGLLVAGVSLAVEGHLNWLGDSPAGPGHDGQAAGRRGAIVFLVVDRFGSTDGVRRWRMVAEADGHHRRGGRRRDPPWTASGGPGSDPPCCTSPPSCTCSRPRRCRWGVAVVLTCSSGVGVP